MNTCHHIASFRFALFLLVLFAPAALAQSPIDGTFLPEGLPAAPGTAQAGIEATGDTAEVRALTVWAEEHHQTDPKLTREIAERALALARNLDDQRGIGYSLTILGHLASDTGQKEAYYSAAHEALERIGDERALVSNQINMGTVYRRQGEQEQALTAYFNALETLERFGNIEDKAKVLNNIGNIYKDEGNWKKALSYYERAAALAETLDEPVRLLSPLNNLGAALVEQGSYEKAETTLRRGLAISEEQGLRLYTAGISNNLGWLFNQQGRYEQALQLLLAAKQVAKELNEDGLLFAVYDELGKAYMGLGQYDQALQYAHESLVLARELVSSRRQMVAHQTLSQIHEAAGDDGRALANYRQYAVIKDSVFTAERAEVIAQMQTRYETEEKQRAIERLEHENQLRLILLVAGVGGLLLLLGFLYYRYRLKQKANRLLEELDKTKSRFFANISHEFRTPLTLLRGPLEDQVEGLSPLQETAEAMLRNTRRMEQLVNEMLDLNRLEAGKLVLKPTPGDLVRTLRRLVEANVPLAERNGISLTFKLDFEHCFRLYDPEKVEKIVGNLLSNALKFTPKGGSAQVELRCGKEAAIIVSDDGPGISAEMKEKIFERFAQVEGGALHGGAGIGLALAKELAGLHGGTITLESEPGEGSTFTVWLPLQTADPVPPKEFAVGGDGLADATAPQTGEDISRQSDIAKTNEAESDRTTVLVIEDNDDVRAYVRQSLEGSYRVLEAADGEAGLQHARAELPDLIVSDVMLPGVDGYEITRRLKTEADTECIPVVMLTARAAEEDQTEGYGSGAEVYITKPFSPETLRAAIARLLEERMRLKRQLQKEAGPAAGNKRENGHAILLARARAAVLENLSDENFGVEELASALNMTRFTLYHRFKSEVSSSPSKFVRVLRMERARELLSDGAGTVSEVAYAVGFKSRVGFSRAYSAHYGVSPSAHLRKEKDKKT